MIDKKIFIDFDGVIFDTEKLIMENKSHNPNISWNEFLEKMDWFQLLKEAHIINNAIEYIIESQKNSKQIAILTKIHSLLEMEAKVKILRSYNVKIPVFFVPPHIKKSQIYFPENGEILIDDSIKNLSDWQQNGGESIYFNDKLDNSSHFKTIRSLSRIL